MRISVCALSAIVAAAVANPAFAESWQNIASLAHAQHADAELDDGGDYEGSGTLVTLGTSGMIGRSTRAAFTLQHEYADYDFSDDAALGAARWNDVQETRLGAQFVLPGRKGIAYVLGSNVGLARENGADTSESLTCGAMLGVSRSFAPDRTLGFGLAFQQRPEHSRLMPVVLVDWRFSERLRLANAHSASPTGGGLELSYQTRSPWVLGAGLAYRNDRFRLSESGGVPDGVAEERSGTVFIHAGRLVGGRNAGSNRLGAISVDFYAGTHFAGEIRVEDSAGFGVVSQDVDPTPFVGAMLTAQF